MKKAKPKMIEMYSESECETLFHNCQFSNVHTDILS
jgi:hypothetical protein